MSLKYSLPCSHCSQTIDVEPKNAGNMIRCSACGKTTAAPTMREIRQLPIVETTLPTPIKAERRVSLAGRWLFLMGLLLLVGGSLTAGCIHFSEASLETDIPEYYFREGDRKALEQASPAKLLEVWDTLVGINMSEWTEHRLRKNQKIAAANQIKKLVAGGVAGFGLLLAASSMLIKPAHPKTR